MKVRYDKHIAEFVFRNNWKGDPFSIVIDWETVGQKST